MNTKAQSILFSFLLIFFLSCSSGQTVDQTGKHSTEYDDVKIDSSVGCAYYRGNQWLQCIDRVLKEYQDIHNSKPSEKIIKEESYRKGDFFYRSVEVCFGPVCRKRHDRIYDPELSGSVMKYAIIGGIGVVLGIGIGVGIPGAIFLFSIL